MVATLFVSAAIFLQSATTSTWSLQSMWSTMSTLPRVVVGILFVLSVYSFGVMIDRALMYSAARKQSRVFVQQVAGALKEAFAHDGPAVVDVVTAKQELAMPPKIELEQAKGFSLYMMRAILNGRGDEIVDLVQTNFR